jgi:hypothetical protein
MLARLVLALALLLPILPAATTPAGAAPPRVAALSCKALARSTPRSQIWWSHFYGERSGLFRPEWHSATGCFKSQANCKAWLYWQMTDWPLEMRWSACRRGLPY